MAVDAMDLLDFDIPSSPPPTAAPNEPGATAASEPPSIPSLIMDVMAGAVPAVVDAMQAAVPNAVEAAQSVVPNVVDAHRRIELGAKPLRLA